MSTASGTKWGIRTRPARHMWAKANPHMPGQPIYPTLCGQDTLHGTFDWAAVECDACDIAGLEGGLRGPLGEAVDWARECSTEWGLRVTLRVDEPRVNLPPHTHPRRADGPTWVIRPVGVA